MKRRSQTSNSTKGVSSSSSSKEFDNLEIIEGSDDDNVETEFFEDSEEENWDDPNRNTVGNIPIEKFYKDFDHIGYNIHGQKIAKPQKQGEIDDFLAKEDDPNYWFFFFNLF